MLGSFVNDYFQNAEITVLLLLVKVCGFLVFVGILWQMILYAWKNKSFQKLEIFNTNHDSVHVKSNTSNRFVIHKISNYYKLLHYVCGWLCIYHNSNNTAHGSAELFLFCKTQQFHVEVYDNPVV